jgi:glycosyltransferase involved in cell wall biosynthesis
MKQKEKKSFVLVYDFLAEPGGLEKLMSIHARYLKEEGHDVKILFGSINKDLVKMYDGFEVIEYGKCGSGMAKVLLGILGFNRLKKIIKPDDIIISYSFPVNVTIRNFPNKRITYLNHFPNFLYLPFKEKWVWANDMKRKVSLLVSLLCGSLLKRLDKKLVNRSDLIFINGGYTKKRLDPIYGIDGIISNPPVSKDIKPMQDKFIKEKYHIGKHRYVFASGRVIPDKHFDWLIEAFSKIDNPDLVLIIAGPIDAKQKKDLSRLAWELNTGVRVDFLGLVPKEDLIKLYTAADVYAFPAPKEDFGLVPAEAISCGTPVVCWGDGSGPNEIIIDKVNGLYAQPYNKTDFAIELEVALKAKWNKKKIIASSKRFSEAVIKKNFIGRINEWIKKN